MRLCTIYKLVLKEWKSSYVGKRTWTKHWDHNSNNSFPQWKLKRGNWNPLFLYRSCRFPSAIRSRSCLERKWLFLHGKASRCRWREQISQPLICQGHKTKSANGFMDNHSVPASSSTDSWSIWFNFASKKVWNKATYIGEVSQELPELARPDSQLMSRHERRNSHEKCWKSEETRLSSVCWTCQARSALWAAARCGMLAAGHQSLTTKRRKLSAVLLLFICFSPANSIHLHLSKESPHTATNIKRLWVGPHSLLKYKTWENNRK